MPSAESVSGALSVTDSPGIQTDNTLLAALAELIQPAVGAVVLDTHGSSRQTLADIGHLCGYRDSAVGLNGVRGDGNIAVRQLGRRPWTA